MSRAPKTHIRSDPKQWPKSVCRTAALKVLAGTATRKDRVLAKCGDCMGGFMDGRVDCGAADWCPLYPDMPYKGKGREPEGSEFCAGHDSGRSSTAPEPSSGSDREAPAERSRPPKLKLRKHQDK